MPDIKKIKDEFLLKLSADLNIENVNQIKSELFGKNGKISDLFKNLGSLPVEERKKFATDLNFIKNELQEKINKKIQEIEKEKERTEKKKEGATPHHGSVRRKRHITFPRATPLPKVIKK